MENTVVDSVMSTLLFNLTQFLTKQLQMCCVTVSGLVSGLQIYTTYHWWFNRQSSYVYLSKYAFESEHHELMTFKKDKNNSTLCHPNKISITSVSSQDSQPARLSSCISQWSRHPGKILIWTAETTLVRSGNQCSDRTTAIIQFSQVSYERRGGLSLWAAQLL